MTNSTISSTPCQILAQNRSRRRWISGSYATCATHHRWITSSAGDRASDPARIVYPAQQVEISIHANPIFEHYIVYSPPEQPFFAVEPVTNANDGFNLFEQGIAGSGVFVLEPGEEKEGVIRLRKESV